MMPKIREYIESYPVRIIEVEDRLAIEAWNEGGNSNTQVDLLDVLEWVRENHPELLRGVFSQ